MNQLRLLKSLNGGIGAVQGQSHTLYREVSSVLWMAGPCTPLPGIAKYFGRFGWTAVGKGGRTFRKGAVRVHLWDGGHHAANGFATVGSTDTNIILRLSSSTINPQSLTQLSRACRGQPTVVLTPADRALYELKGFRITNLEVVITPGGVTGKQLEESRASARMLGEVLEAIGKFAIKYYVGRLVPGDRTFERQKGYGRKLIEKSTGKLLPDFKEGFEQIIDGISEALMSIRGVSIHSKITYETEQKFLNTIPYWSKTAFISALQGPLVGGVWPFQSTKQVIANATEWDGAYYDALVEQLDCILPHE